MENIINPEDKSIDTQTKWFKTEYIILNIMRTVWVTMIIYGIYKLLGAPTIKDQKWWALSGALLLLARIWFINELATKSLMKSISFHLSKVTRYKVSEKTGRGIDESIAKLNEIEHIPDTATIDNPIITIAATLVDKTCASVNKHTSTLLTSRKILDFKDGHAPE